MKIALSLLATLGLTLAAATAAFAAETVEWYTDLDEAREEARESGRPLLLYVTTTNCAFCVKMKQETLKNATVAAEVNARFVPIVIDRGTQPALEKKLGVNLYPTIVFIEADDVEVRRLIGYSPPSVFVQTIKRIEAEWLAANPRNGTTVK